MRKSSSGSEVISLGRARIEGTREARVVAIEDGRPLIDSEDNPFGALPARPLAGVTPGALRRAFERGDDVLVLFHAGSTPRATIIGVLAGEDDAAPLEILRDDERVCLKAASDVVLRCGKSELVLTREGQVKLRGVDVTSQARRKNRARGGDVFIN